MPASQLPRRSVVPAVTARTQLGQILKRVQERAKRTRASKLGIREIETVQFVSGEIDGFMALVLRVGITVHSIKTLTISRDEPDNRFLECSGASRANFLVTGNTKHFHLATKTHNSNAEGGPISN